MRNKQKAIVVIRCHKFFFAVCLILVAAECWAAFGPVGPTNDVVSKSNKNGTVINDLPYKPVVEDEEEKMPDWSDNALAETKKPEEKIDWTTIPYIPFKRPDLLPARDPEIIP